MCTCMCICENWQVGENASVSVGGVPETSHPRTLEGAGLDVCATETEQSAVPSLISKPKIITTDYNLKGYCRI